MRSASLDNTRTNRPDIKLAGCLFPCWGLYMLARDLVLLVATSSLEIRHDICAFTLVRGTTSCLHLIFRDKTANIIELKPLVRDLDIRSLSSFLIAKSKGLGYCRKPR